MVIKEQLKVGAPPETLAPHLFANLAVGARKRGEALKKSCNKIHHTVSVRGSETRRVKYDASDLSDLVTGEFVHTIVGHAMQMYGRRHRKEKLARPAAKYSAIYVRNYLTMLGGEKRERQLGEQVLR